MRAIPLDIDEQEADGSADSSTDDAAPSRTLSAAWRALPLLVRVMFCLDATMGLLYFFSRRVKHLIPTPLLRFFDLNGEANLPSWYSAAQLALIGGLLCTFAIHELRRGARAAWAVLLGGAGFLFLSLDETTSLHENFGYWLDHLKNRRETTLHETGFWMLICAPIFLAGVALVGWAARRYLRGRAGVVIKFAIGSCVLVAAGAGVEMLSNFVTPQGTAARGLIMLEEVGEMAGATIMLWAVVDFLASYGMRLIAIEERSAGR
jgi:hypothetical protein